MGKPKIGLAQKLNFCNIWIIIKGIPSSFFNQYELND